MGVAATDNSSWRKFGPKIIFCLKWIKICLVAKKLSREELYRFQGQGLSLDNFFPDIPPVLLPLNGKHCPGIVVERFKSPGQFFVKKCLSEKNCLNPRVRDNYALDNFYRCWKSAWFDNCPYLWNFRDNFSLIIGKTM